MESQKIRLSELLNAAQYRERRPKMLRDIIALKTLRRVELGPWVSFVFENRETVVFQIQEMLRIEHIDEPEKIEHEIDTYSELLPGPGELSATLFIEITNAAQRREALTQLAGIEKNVSLQIGGLRIPAEDKRPFDRIYERPQASCVYYLRFAVKTVSREAFL